GTCFSAIALIRFPCSADLGSLYMMAECKGWLFISKGMTVPEVDVTEIARISSLFRLSGRFLIRLDRISRQSSHHSCGDCTSRKVSSNWNFRESDAINSPLSSTKTTLAPWVPTSNPKKYLLIYETTSLKVLRAFFHS